MSESLLSLLRDDLAQISAAASHDLADPLREALLLLRQSNDPALQNAQHRIQTSLARIQLLRDYSYLSVSNEKPEPLDLHAVLESIRQSYATQIKQSGAQIIAGGLPVIPARRDQLEHLLLQLIKNAIQFNDSATPLLTLSSEEHASYWLISLRDNGEGIEPEFHTIVFGLFRRIRDDRPGHGAGLAFCKRIVQLHGGSIGIESEKGAFTRIVIHWPKQLPL